MKNLLTMLAACLLACCDMKQTEAASGSAAQPSIAVTIDGGDMMADWKSYPRILMAAWPDGRVVWSEDQRKGGPPFRFSTANAAAIETTLVKFEKAGVFDENSFSHFHSGPDSTFHSIWLRHGDKHTRIGSWHELRETNPNLVAIDGSITTLNGRKREDVIASDTKEFQAFRKLWIELRTATSALIPKEGALLAEPLELKLPR